MCTGNCIVPAALLPYADLLRASTTIKLLPLAAQTKNQPLNVATHHGLNRLTLGTQAPLPAEAAQEPQTVELDQWLIEFANLFREHTGLDPERHLDLNAVGWDRIQVSPSPEP